MNYTANYRLATVGSRLFSSLLLGLCWLGLGQLTEARTATQETRPKGRAFDHVVLAKNQWRLSITNYGAFGHDVIRGGAGGEWPRGSGNMYIYGAGIWFGRLRKYPGGAVDTNVTIGYNPNSGKSEFTPGAAANAGSGYAGRTFERVYMYPEIWPPNPADFPESMRDSIKLSLKIPPSGAGETIFGWFYPIPRTITSTGDCWSVFNDLDVSLMEQPSKAKSCGIEVYQYTYCWSLPWNRDVVFFVCNVKNVTSDTIKDAYMAMANDGDIGGAGNDFAGLLLSKYIHNQSFTDSIWVDNVGVEWSGPETGWQPGAVAFDFLQSPYKRDSLGRVPGIDGIDNNGNGLIDEPAEGEQLGMTAFKIFTLGDGDPIGDGQQYLAMQGRNFWESQYPPTYEPYDSTRGFVSADQRFMQATGPFTIAPDSMVTLTIAVIGAPMSHAPVNELPDRDTSFYALAVNDRAAQQAYDNNWISPVPPPSPSFVLQPGYGRVTILWDNAPERVPDPFYPFSRALKSPFYQEYDFQGYKIWRSQTGNIGDWTLLAQFDKRDGIMFEDTTQPAETRNRAVDNGLSYAYIDSVGLRYGFPYYYAVTSYDWNTLGGDPNPTDTTHLTSESGMLPRAVTTRTEAANYQQARAEVRQTAGNPEIGVEFRPTIISPQAVRTDTYQVCFGPQGHTATYAPIYSVALLSRSGDTLVPAQTFVLDPRARSSPAELRATVFDSVVQSVRYDTARGETIRTRGWLPLFETALEIRLDSVSQPIYDSVHRVSGSYPTSLIRPPSRYPANFDKFLWAYRGSDYRLVWRTNANGKLYPEVTDLATGTPVFYRRAPLQPPPAPDSAEGWCLYDTASNSLLIRRPVDTLTLFRTKSLYLNGGLVELNYQRDTGFPVQELPSEGDTWELYAVRFLPAPSNAVYQIRTRPEEFGAARMQLNVKVVPNPYLVRNEWERHPDFRKLKFINLPSDCKIRIYTMAGDLIRTLEHHATNARSGNVPNQLGGDEDWDLLSTSGQKPAPGVYIFHIESSVGEQVGKFAIVY